MSYENTPDTPLVATLRFVFEGLDGTKIRDAVDEDGIDEFILKAALLSGATGAAAGSAGAATLLVGMPADLANSLLQQARVTVAVIYHRTGNYLPSLEQALKVMAVAIGAEIAIRGAVIATEKMLVRASQDALLKAIGKQLARRMSTKMVGRMVPLLGGALGAVFNFGFIQGYGHALLAITSNRLNELLT